MKKLLILCFGILLFLPLVMAQDETNAGITPNIRGIYGLDRTFERIRMMFTFREQSKINYELKLADERIAEMNSMKERENFEALERARKGYEFSIQRINGQNVSEESKSMVRERLRIQLRNLDNILDGIPTQERTNLRNTIETGNKVRGQV